MKGKLGGDATDGQTLSHSPWLVTVGIKPKKREGAVLSVGTDIRGVSSGSPAVFHIDG